MRTSFILELQLQLNTTMYAVLKNTNESLINLPKSSDIDIAIVKGDIPNVIKFVKNHLSVLYVISKRKTFMHTIEIHLKDSSFLSIDMIFDFIRKGHRYLSIQKILKNRIFSNGMYVPHVLDDIEYTQQFYTLNNSDIPVKYKDLYADKLIELDLLNAYFNFFKKNYNLKFNDFESSFIYTKKKKKALKNRSTPIIERFKLTINYIKDLITDITENKGFIITFSGVDGAGKTTIINDVKKTIETIYRKKVILLRHRPGILPIISSLKHGGSSKKAEAAAGNRLPRQGKNNSIISSIIRFTYYYIDYLIGQLYIYCRYVLRGKVVIYDRYYYDFINDSKRSNIKLDRNIIKSLFRFILRPNYNFYLFNTAKVILKRKKELSADDINELNLKYQILFDQLQQNNNAEYTKIKNDDRNETVKLIFENIYGTPA